MAYKHYPAYLFLSYDMCRHPISEATLEITLTRKNREFALTLFFIITAEEEKKNFNRHGLLFTCNLLFVSNIF